MAPATHHAVHDTDVPLVLPQPGVHVPADGVQAVQVWCPPGRPAALGDLWGPLCQRPRWRCERPTPHWCLQRAALSSSEACREVPEATLSWCSRAGNL